MNNAQQLGYDYFYHYNEYSKRWFCIHKDSLNNYTERNPKQPMNWKDGSDVEDAAAHMLTVLHTVTAE